MPTRPAGSLLIITLWLVTILAVLVVAIARYLSLDLRLTKYRLALDQAKTLARSGIYLGMQRLEQDGRNKEQGGKEYDWLGDDWADFKEQGAKENPRIWVIPSHIMAAAAQFSGQVEVEILDEDRKRDVNAAKSAELARLVDSSDVAEAIVDYRDDDRDGAWEQTVERPPYAPKNAPAVTLTELRDVPGQTEETFARLEQFTFAVPGTNPINKVNINTASREVLIAVGLPTLAETIIQFRDAGHYFTNLSPTLETESPAQPAPFESTHTEFSSAVLRNALSVASDTFTVMSTGVVSDPSVRVRIEAVVRRVGCAEGVPSPCIIAWREG